MICVSWTCPRDAQYSAKAYQVSYDGFEAHQSAPSGVRVPGLKGIEGCRMFSGGGSMAAAPGSTYAGRALGVTGLAAAGTPSGEPTSTV